LCCPESQVQPFPNPQQAHLIGLANNELHATGAAGEHRRRHLHALLPVVAAEQVARQRAEGAAPVPDCAAAAAAAVTVAAAAAGSALAMAAAARAAGWAFSHIGLCHQERVIPADSSSSTGEVDCAYKLGVSNNTSHNSYRMFASDNDDIAEQHRRLAGFASHLRTSQSLKRRKTR